MVPEDYLSFRSDFSVERLLHLADSQVVWSSNITEADASKCALISEAMFLRNPVCRPVSDGNGRYALRPADYGRAAIVNCSTEAGPEHWHWQSERIYDVNPHSPSNPLISLS
jgi:hypothetical protein